ncbi:DUF4336 domain-containing protein [Pseudooceanicola sp. LIPI14-2-Ac024]|uniref:DUF4336 domain-containing protein n=1 Tax=Pseudooceanicola sp. LIPI14-2-Ac024 TaxID=3344875 RepID=UPI0035CFF062
MGTGYEPLEVLKPVADDIWIVDGPEIRFYGMPFSTRMTVVRLSGGGLWIHSPIKLSLALKARIAALGQVKALIAPSVIHYAYLTDWKHAFPEAEAWIAPGVERRAERHGIPLEFDHYLAGANPDWAADFDWLVVRGSKTVAEAVFHHRASRTLILTDLIENFEKDKKPWWMWPILRATGIAAPNGSMPRDMRMTFRGNEDLLREDIERMIDWDPKRVIVAHGRWFEDNGAAELKRAFGWLLDG